MRPVLALALALASCSSGPTEPHDLGLYCPPMPRWEREYFENTCAAAGMVWLRGTHTCVEVKSYINLAEPKR